MISSILHFLQQIVTLGGTYNWDYVWTYFFASDILQGLLLTIIIAIFAQVVGSLIGLALYFVRRAKNRVLRSLAIGYITVFRGTPLIVQILFLNAFLPYVHLARPIAALNPFQHLGFTNQIPFDAFIAGSLALAFNEGAYMSEIVRAGIDSIDVGQLEAAKSLGMTYGLAMRRIVLPQALRVIVPPLGNEFNGMLKNTSLVSFIAVAELLESAQSRAASLFAPLEMFTIAAIWYLILTMIWTVIQAFIERRLNASNLDPSLRGTPWWQRTFGVGTRKPQTVGTDVVPELLGDRR
jgi:polar amino acid transport system permease protein